MKAILVYPMNALAFDQARRIAKVVHGNPALRGKVSAGLYVGERERLPHTTMGPEHLITDRETLRERPPHILLTNYKMLDFLMIRPPDARLWRHNQAGALRYLVVDELHTFDGPQGTDLACLIRRLKDRLQVPRRGLVCVGTSATVGGEENRAELRKYVAGLFGQPFDGGAILTEERQSIDDVLGSAIIQRHLSPRPSLAEITDPARYPNAETYLKAQHELFFGAAIEGDYHANDWRIALAAKLREHLMFVNLLRTVAEGPLPFVDVVARMRASLPLSAEPAQAQREAVGLLNALCALIAAAREDDGAGGAKPFLRMGLHLWVRELRRMVCPAKRQPGSCAKLRAVPRTVREHRPSAVAGRSAPHVRIAARFDSPITTDYIAKGSNACGTLNRNRVLQELDRRSAWRQRRNQPKGNVADRVASAEPRTATLGYDVPHGRHNRRSQEREAPHHSGGSVLRCWRAWRGSARCRIGNGPRRGQPARGGTHLRHELRQARLPAVPLLGRGTAASRRHRGRSAMPGLLLRGPTTA